MKTKTISLRKLTLASTVALTAGWGAMAQAQTADLAVSSDVVESCSINTTALGFGNYDPVAATAVDNTGTVSVTCTSGASAVITLGQGINFGTGSTDADPVRRMVHATEATAFLTYTLFQGTGRTTEWGNTELTGVNTTGTGAAVDHTVHGRIDGSQTTALGGSYSDTVVATVTVI